VDCEVCAQKKATIRRTCIGNLPNTMVLHLKRFDLDFQTFETVKLNNLMAFNTKLNMLKYTKEGIEAEERREQATEAARGNSEGGRREDDSVSYDTPATDFVEPDPEDFEYELQVRLGLGLGLGLFIPRLVMARVKGP
jgi:hypothetical protein